MNQFGQIIDGSYVEQAVIDLLKVWSPSYLAEVARQRSLASLPNIRTYTVTSQFEKWPEDQLPTVLVISTGLAEPPKQRGDGKIDVCFLTGLAVIVSADTPENTNKIAKAYTAAIRAALAQHKSLGGKTDGLTWLDEKYDDLPPEQTRTIGAGQLVFEVDVKNVTDASAGPLSPTIEDPGDWPQVLTHHIDVKEKA